MQAKNTMLRFYNMAQPKIFSAKESYNMFIFKEAKMKRFCKKTAVAAAVLAFCAHANAAEPQKSLSDIAIEQGTDVLIKNQVEGKSLKQIGKEKKEAAKAQANERAEAFKKEHGLDSDSKAEETKMPTKAEIKQGIKDEINTRTKAAKQEIGAKALEHANEKTGGAAGAGVEVYKAVKDAKKAQ